MKKRCARRSRPAQERTTLGAPLEAHLVMGRLDMEGAEPAPSIVLKVLSPRHRLCLFRIQACGCRLGKSGARACKPWWPGDRSLVDRRSNSGVSLHQARWPGDASLVERHSNLRMSLTPPCGSPRSKLGGATFDPSHVAHPALLARGSNCSEATFEASHVARPGLPIQGSNARGATLAAWYVAHPALVVRGSKPVWSDTRSLACRSSRPGGPGIDA